MDPTPIQQVTAQAQDLTIIIAVVGTIASIATCGYVVFIFKRLFANHDKMSEILSKLTEKISAIELTVAQDYIDDDRCGTCKKDLTDRISILHININEHSKQSEQNLSALNKQMARVETRVDATERDIKSLKAA